MEEHNVYPSKTNMKFIGRVFLLNLTAWLIHSGSAIEFIFTGTYLKTKILSDGTSKRDLTSLTRYAIFINDTKSKDLLMKDEEINLEIINEKQENTWLIKIIKLTEETYGSIGINLITFKSEKSEAIKPTEKKNLMIEFIGDSITCGYGVEGKSPNERFRTKYENFMKTYAYITSQELDSDYSVTCKSGFGIMSGQSEKFYSNLYEDAGLLYKFKDYKRDFTENIPDIIVINIGTNDYEYLMYGTKEMIDKFLLGYKNFLKMIRKNNPNALILCIYGMMGKIDLFEHLKTAIREYKEESDDDAIKYFLCYKIQNGDGVGTAYHPNEISNLRNGKFLAKQIRKLLLD